MTKKILVVLSLAGILAASMPGPDVQAAWRVTDQGRQYTTNSTIGYAVGLKKIKGAWYFFSKEGIMKTGWVYADKEWRYFRANGRMARNMWIGSYYLQTDGTMARNTVVNGVTIGADGCRVADSGSDLAGEDNTAGSRKKNGWYSVGSQRTWYYYNDKGAKTKGWLTLPDGKYYLDPSTGAMETGFIKLGKVTYYFNPSNGRMRTGWFKVKNRRYCASKSGAVKNNRWLKKKRIYVGRDGAALTGWAKVKGNRYYFDLKTAKTATGWRQINGSWYYFGQDGVMVRKKWVVYGATGKKCYLQADGRMANSRWIGKYYVDENGLRTGQTRKKGLFTEDGRLYYNDKKYNRMSGWITMDGGKYYFGGDHAAVTGMQTIDGRKYYFDEGGIMQTGIVEAAGKTYYFNAEGVMEISGNVTIDGETYMVSASGTLIEPEFPADTSKGRRIVTYAKKFLGNPYVPAGTSLTNGADCSGFTMSVMEHFDISIPRVAKDQATGYSQWGGIYNKGKQVTPDVDYLLPGDLVFYYSPIGHVGIYIGNGFIIHASNSQTGIIISEYDYSKPVSAMRYWA